MKRILKKMILLLCFSALPISVIAQSEITEIEYFLNSDPGLGNGISLDYAPVEDGNMLFDIDTSSLSIGVHILFIRAKNIAGEWGLYNAIPFSIHDAPSYGEHAQLTEIEYFTGADPGFGQGMSLEVNTGTELSLEREIPVNELAAQTLNIHFRAKNEFGLWGLTKVQPFTVSPSGTSSEPLELTGLEYFFNEDPGLGNGTFVSVENNTEIEITLNAQASGLEAGSHVFYARVRSENGLWGHIVEAAFEMNENVRFITFIVDMSIQQANGFFDPDNQVVYVRGEFNNWTLASMEHTENGLFETERQVFGLEGEEMEYKFYYANTGDASGGTWESEVGPGTDGNRVLTLSQVNEPMILNPVFFNNQETVIDVPDVVTLLFPEHQATDVELIPEFIWDDEEAATSYHFQLSVSETFEELLFDINEIAETYIIPDDELDELTMYFWRVRAWNQVGYSDWSETFELTTLQFTSIENPTIPTVYALRQNYPNPFNPVTVIRFDLPEASDVLLEMYNIAGQRVAVLKRGLMQAGSHHFVFSATHLSSGMYVYRLHAGDQVFVRKMTLIK